jgi:hypothetical protein
MYRMSSPGVFNDFCSLAMSDTPRDYPREPMVRVVRYTVLYCTVLYTFKQKMSGTENAGDPNCGYVTRDRDNCPASHRGLCKLAGSVV